MPEFACFGATDLHGNQMDRAVRIFYHPMNKRWYVCVHDMFVIINGAPHSANMFVERILNTVAKADSAAAAVTASKAVFAADGQQPDDYFQVGSGATRTGAALRCVTYDTLRRYLDIITSEARPTASKKKAVELDVVTKVCEELRRRGAPPPPPPQLPPAAFSSSSSSSSLSSLLSSSQSRAALLPPSSPPLSNSVAATAVSPPIRRTVSVIADSKESTIRSKRPRNTDGMGCGGGGSSSSGSGSDSDCESVSRIRPPRCVTVYRTSLPNESARQKFFRTMDSRTVHTFMPDMHGGHTVFSRTEVDPLAVHQIYTLTALAGPPPPTPLAFVGSSSSGSSSDASVVT